jgi:hypothetical protein
MSAVYAMTGGYIAAARRLVRDSADEFAKAQDKNTAWDLLTTRLMDLYEQHVKDLRRHRQQVLRRLHYRVQQEESLHGMSDARAAFSTLKREMR